MVASLFTVGSFAQDRTTVTATSYDISDNLDLRAVASIFGESANLEDFERRLNDPKTQISNLDLNGDRQVDYLRVIESVENGAHLIVIQSVLDKDVYQDVATIEVERDSNNAVQVQVVGNVYMYGANYVYEPVYVTRPIIYDYFWVAGYRPYWSSWYWGYYPSYYYYWEPFPVFRYRNHIHTHINVHNHYTYVNNPRNVRSYSLRGNYRGNGYETRNPGRAFNERNNVRNSYELQQVRRDDASGNTTPRNTTGVRGNATGGRNNAASTGAGTQTDNVRTQTGTRSNTATRSNDQVSTNSQTPRANTGVRTESSAPRTNTTINTGARTESTAPRVNTTPVRTETQTRTNTSVRTEAPRVQQQQRTEAPRVQQQQRSETPRMSAPQQSAPRSQGNAGGGNSRGNESRGGGRR